MWSQHLAVGIATTLAEVLLRYQCTLSHHKEPISKTVYFSKQFLKNGESIPGAFSDQRHISWLENIGRGNFAQCGTFNDHDKRKVFYLTTISRCTGSL